MTVIPEFEVSIKLTDLDGVTTIFDLSDGDAGFWVVDHTPTDEVMEFGENESPFVNGNSENWAKDSAGRYEVSLRIVGESWAQVEANRLALRAAYRSASHYLLDVTVEGVLTRYRARRPDVSLGAVTTMQLKNSYRPAVLSFPVQPNPTVTGV